MNQLTPGQERRLASVVEATGWDARSLRSGRFVRLLDPEGARETGPHVEVGLLNLSGSPTSTLLDEIGLRPGVLLSDAEFEVDSSHAHVVLGERTVRLDCDFREFVHRAIDEKHLLQLPNSGELPHTHLHANPFALESQLAAASIGSQTVLSKFAVRIHDEHEDGMREIISLIDGLDESDAALRACAAMQVAEPVAVEVFRSVFNPLVNGAYVMKMTHRRRLSVNDCIRFYHLPNQDFRAR